MKLFGMIIGRLSKRYLRCALKCKKVDSMFYIIPVYVYLQHRSDRVTAPDSRVLKERNNQGHAAFSAHCVSQVLATQ